MRLVATPGRGVAGLALCASIAACSNEPTGIQQSLAEQVDAADLASIRTPSGTRLVPLGQAIFGDMNLSLGKNQSCASCHDAAFGFTSPNTSINAHGSVLPGSISTRFGTRKAPSVAYATQAPALFYDPGDDTFVGGNFWDGRATGARLGIPAAEQSQFPIVSPVEQALPDRACAIYRIATGSYRNVYTTAWGNNILTIKFPKNTDQKCAIEGTTIELSKADRAKVDKEYDHVALSIAAFENSPLVNAFSSKYDAVIAKQSTLTTLEKQGLRLYEGKAGCAACHPNGGQKPLFTDFTYDNIGVPANPENPRRVSDPSFRDLGLGGFLLDTTRNGAQKVPTLRNLDKRPSPLDAKSFMHNGVFKTLEQVVHFYNTRDVLGDCAKRKNPQFGVNCWPQPEVLENVNQDELGNLHLTAPEEAAVVAYLKTLSDGYTSSVAKR
jgi:cytochrome c peroxidase